MTSQPRTIVDHIWDVHVVLHGAGCTRRAVCRPEAALGGPIAFVRDGDPIIVDVDARWSLDIEADADERDRRRAGWVPPRSRYTTGVFAKYGALVSSASEGPITRPGRHPAAGRNRGQ
ncbi:MAG: dihydroxy-acid dehydratase [Chloroflexota bacterium]|nr:dihydroxy-acid dehydratase [Chloroflexota bacterium]